MLSRMSEGERPGGSGKVHERASFRGMWRRSIPKPWRVHLRMGRVLSEVRRGIRTSVVKSEGSGREWFTIIMGLGPSVGEVSHLLSPRSARSSSRVMMSRWWIGDSVFGMGGEDEPLSPVLFPPVVPHTRRGMVSRS